MPLVTMTELVSGAQAGGYAVGYFEAWDNYSLEAVMEAAEMEGAPVILGFGCMMAEEEWLDRGESRCSPAWGCPWPKGRGCRWRCC